MIWQNVLLSYISLFALGLADSIRGPVYPEILKTFSLSNSVGSLLFAVSSIMCLVGGFHSPLLLQRWSLYRLLSFSLLCLTLGLLIITLSPHYMVLLVGAALVGYSFGPLGIAQNSLLILGTTPQTRVKWMSGLHAVYGFASFLAPLIVAVVAHTETPWRMSYGIITLILVIVSAVSIRTRAPVPIKADKPKTDSYGFTRFEFHITLVIAFYVMAELLVGTRLAQFMRNEMNFDLRTSSLSVTLFYLLMVIGRVIASFLFSPKNLKNVMMLSLLITFFCMLAGGFFHPYFWILTGLTMAPFYAWSMTFVGETFHLSFERAIALIISLDALFIVMMHLIVGAITDMSGIGVAMWLAPGFIFVSLACLWFFRHERIQG